MLSKELLKVNATHIRDSLRNDFVNPKNPKKFGNYEMMERLVAAQTCSQALLNTHKATPYKDIDEFIGEEIANNMSNKLNLKKKLLVEDIFNRR